ncbi:MAG: PEP/pyruvate-binding domain-containing protein [Pseudomonadota bacterium]
MFEFLGRLFSRRRDTKVDGLFKDRYTNFKAILDANSELLRLLSSMDRMLEGRTLFGMAYVRSQGARALFYAARMVRSYEQLSGRLQPRLHESLNALRVEIGRMLGEVGHRPPATDLVLPHVSVGRAMIDSVGGKNANLGEMAGAVGLPVPRGFALTTAAYQLFLDHNQLGSEIDKAQRAVDPERPETLMEASQVIQTLFLQGKMPPALEQSMSECLVEVFGQDDTLRLALRSSAIGEDGELSFAGQYKSILGLVPSRMVESYKLILASLFSPRAIAYRLSNGILSEETAMGVACLEMVDPLASGVAYSRDPLAPGRPEMVINAVWGLGTYAVDGRVDPDRYRVSRADPPEILATEAVPKEVMLTMRPGGGVEERPVPAEDRANPCLSHEQIGHLARCMIRLEEHFGSPQDVEWALDHSGRLLFLQCRPLQMSGAAFVPPDLPQVDAPVLLEGAEVACPGVGSGPVHLVRKEEDLAGFPRGAVLVAEHSSPIYSLVMSRAAAVVTEHGSVTGHMASLAREYRLPALLGARGAMTALEEGREVTVDAWLGRVLEGRVEPLLALRTDDAGRLMVGTPVYEALRALGALVLPLNLTDPKSPDFQPGSCRTVHDVMRYVHERCYEAMFAISDLASSQGEVARKLNARLPLDLHVIDLGGGLDVDDTLRVAAVHQVVSSPFAALLRGMLDERLRPSEPRPVDMSGFMSVMSRQMFSTERERFGEKSYAIITDKYLNFSSRVGYHYGVLDAYCGQTVNSNYINFQFKGGAADDVRRNRRVRAIGLILEGIGFRVEVEADMIKARFAKYPCDEIATRLEDVGRLLIYTRQMDMLMKDEGSVERLARGFLEGDFSHDWMPSVGGRWTAD